MKSKTDRTPSKSAEEESLSGELSHLRAPSPNPASNGQPTSRPRVTPTAAPFNRHQKRFFRKLRSHPAGLPIEQWPAADVLQRWMRQPAFRDRLRSIEAMPRVQWKLTAVAVATAALREISIDRDDLTARVNSAVRLYRLVRKGMARPSEATSLTPVSEVCRRPGFLGCPTKNPSLRHTSDTGVNRPSMKNVDRPAIQEPPADTGLPPHDPSATMENT